LARELVERYALNDLKMFEAFVDEGEAKYEDPLERTIAFLVIFEEYISNSTDPAPPAFPGAMPALAMRLTSAQIIPTVPDISSASDSTRS